MGTHNEAAEKEWKGEKGNLALKRKLYRELVAQGRRAEAHLALVSPHISAVKRNPFFALWHMQRAASHARRAILFGVIEGKVWSEGQLNVICSALVMTPWILGGSPRLAQKFLVPVFGRPTEVPHDRALNWILLAKIAMKQGAPKWDTLRYYGQAIRLKDDIFVEPDLLMAKRQWVRIAFAAGVAFWEEGRRKGEYSLQAQAEQLLYGAQVLARAVADDRLKHKINPWLEKHGVLQ